MARPSSWGAAPGAIACAGALALAFVPDERLSRLKLQSVELFILAMLAAVCLRFFFGGERGAAARGVALSVAAYLAVNAGLAMLSPARAVAAAEFIRVATAAAAFFAFAWAGFDGRWEKRLLFVWALSAGLVAGYGLLQHTGGVGRLVVPQMDRVMGTFGNPIFFSAYLVPSLFVSLAAWRVCAGAGRWAVGAAIALEAAALALTQTRSAYLAAAAAVLVVAFFGRRSTAVRVAALGVVVSAAVAVALIADRDQAHLLIWRDTVKLWLVEPWTGVGLGAFHLRLPDVAGADLTGKWPAGQFVVNHAHNAYLQSLAEGGPLALLALLAVVGAFKIHLRRHGGESVTLLLGAAGFAGFAQNLFSADFRFGVSHATSFLLLGWAAGRSTGTAPAGRPFDFPFRRAAGAGFLIGIAFVAWARTSYYASGRAAAAAPGFFDQRIVDAERVTSEFEARASADRNNADELERLAVVYARQMRRADGSVDAEMGARAIEAFQGVVRIAPDRVGARNNLGNALFTMGRADAAASEWRKAAELDSGFVDPRLNLGKTAYVRGDLKEAARRFEEVLAIDPSNAEAKLYLRRMVE